MNFFARIRNQLGRQLVRLASLVTDQRYMAVPSSSVRSRMGQPDLLPVRYSYRASQEGHVTYQLLEAGTSLTYRLYAMSFDGVTPVKGDVLLERELSAVRPGDTITVHLETPSLSVNGELVPGPATPTQCRKFVAELRMTVDGSPTTRLCSHYLPFAEKPIGGEYYFGDDYIDYPQQTAAMDAVELVKSHCQSGKLLDVGLCFGVYLAAFREAGFDAKGMDVSEFAIREAAKRVDQEHARCASLEDGEIPFEGEFDVIWMWDVLEHFRDPRAALEKVSRRTAPGGRLFLHTSNADSLTHRVFGEDWEGYSDYSHFGVDQVTCESLRSWLREFGWHIDSWKCRSIWAEGLDPVVLELKEAFQRAPALQLLLHEADLGDAIQLVAIKE